MSWPTILASEAMLKRGGSVNPSKFPDEVFDLLSIPAFDRGKVDVLEGAEIGSSKSCVEPNDVLLSKIIPHVKRCWVVPKKGVNRQIGSGEWIIFRDKRFYPPFLRHFLTSDKFHRQFMNTVAGIGGSLVRARPAFVEKIEIPLPPLKEQKRIAAILDKADAIRRKRQQAIKLADDFLRSVFLDMFGDPVSNPKGWNVVNIEAVCSEIVDCINKTAKTVNYRTSYKMIRTTNVRNMKIDLTEVRFAEKSIYDKWVSRLKPERGDIVFTREAPAGEAGIVDFDDLVFLGQRTMQFRPDRKVVASSYLLYEMMGSGIKQQMGKMSSGSTVKHLSVPECKKFKVRRPPIDLQKKFDEIRMKTLGSINDMSKSSRASIFESLSQKAFSGKLS
ncbi:restriction endonuclease subunit S [Teredinibacter purpureus]|uniref:restriction endonuclease subunit S n=1 Tax=Teredinibacter purpureus TaxID=2731756 RepID=UPI0005F7E608|nr:restriction endonuclease subunit S [Teredinibacter purpureus]